MRTSGVLTKQRAVIAARLAATPAGPVRAATTAATTAHASEYVHCAAACRQKCLLLL
jgi:hypothetical protein